MRNELSNEGEAEDERSTVGNKEYGETVWGSEKSPEGSEEEEMKKMKMVSAVGEEKESVSDVDEDEEGIFKIL